MPKTYNKTDKYNQSPAGTRSVRRALAIIQAVVNYNDKGITLSKIAKDVDMPISTVKRILSVLVSEGFVSLDRGSKNYNIGYEFSQFAIKSKAVRFQVKYRNMLEHIAQRTGDTAYLIVRSGLEGVCVDVAGGAQSVRIPYGIGTKMPLGIGTSGIALLAVLSDDEIAQILKKNRPRYKGFDFDINEVWQLIYRYRRRGYVRYDNRFIDGIVGVAVPIANNNKEAEASITVSSTAARMTLNRCKKLAQIMKEEISIFH